MVNSVPNVVLVSDDINNIICEGDNILFTSSGANNYEFFIDGSSQGASSPTTTLSTATLTSTVTIEVIGEFNNCFSNSLPINVIVNSLPVINTTISDADTLICDGDLVTISANGASTYQLLINNTPTASPNIQNQFDLTTLGNGDIVTVQGNSANGIVYSWGENKVVVGYETTSIRIEFDNVLHPLFIPDTVITSPSLNVVI